MRRKHNDTWMEAEPELDVQAGSFLPDEQTETSQQALAELRTRVNKLEQQVHALYTSMASYATIAERNTETAKQEARADLDRTQGTLIGLMEKLRRDLGGHVGPGYGGVAVSAINSDRALHLDERLDALANSVEQLARQQAELQQHVARLVEAQMHADGWLVSNGPAETLSLH